MQYCVDHPEEISKLAKVKAQVSEVKGVMMENIEKVGVPLSFRLIGGCSMVLDTQTNCLKCSLKSIYIYLIVESMISKWGIERDCREF